MDRIDAMGAFVAAVDEGSLAAAARRLGRSPAALTRAVAFLEARAGVRLLERTTRALRLTEAGERYLATCRRVLAELEEADLLAAGERAEPRGVLHVTAPALFGHLHVRPLVDAFLATAPAVRVRLLLLDRVVGLVDEGIDVAVRIGHLPDSSLIAVKVGELRRIACAAPGYLAGRPPVELPADLAAHACIAFAQAAAGELWTFGPGPDGAATRPVRLRPRLTVNAAEAAVASAAEGHGVVRVLHYQAERELAEGRLVRLLRDFEPPPVPVHVIYPQGRLSAAKARAFVELAVPGLRRALARIAL